MNLCVCCGLHFRFYYEKYNIFCMNWVWALITRKCKKWIKLIVRGSGEHWPLCFLVRAVRYLSTMHNRRVLPILYYGILSAFGNLKKITKVSENIQSHWFVYENIFMASHIGFKCNFVNYFDNLQYKQNHVCICEFALHINNNFCYVL